MIVPTQQSAFATRFDPAPLGLDRTTSVIANTELVATKTLVTDNLIENALERAIVDMLRMYL